MKKNFPFDKLSPKAQERARKAHIDYLRPYFRDVLEALFELELRMAGYADTTIIFDPDPSSLVITDITIEADEIDPSIVDYLYRVGVTELEHQCSSPVIEESILAEGLWFYANGSPAYFPCKPYEYRFYDGMLFVGGNPYFSLAEFAGNYCAAKGLDEDAATYMAAELEKALMYQPRRKAEEIEAMLLMIRASLPKAKKKT